MAKKMSEKKQTVSRIEGMTEEELKTLRQLEAKRKALQRDIPRMKELIEKYPDVAKEYTIKKFRLKENSRTENDDTLKSLKDYTEANGGEVSDILSFLRNSQIQSNYNRFLQTQKSPVGQAEPRNADMPQTSGQNVGQIETVASNGQQSNAGAISRNVVPNVGQTEPIVNNGQQSNAGVISHNAVQAVGQQSDAYNPTLNDGQ